MDTRQGRFLDAICDKIGEGVLLIAISFRGGDFQLATLTLVAAVLGLTASYSKALALTASIRRAEWRYTRWFGRACRVLIVGFGLLATGLADSERGLWMTIAALAIFNGVTLVERMYRALSAPS